MVHSQQQACSQNILTSIAPNMRTDCSDLMDTKLVVDIVRLSSRGAGPLSGPLPDLASSSPGLSSNDGLPRPLSLEVFRLWCAAFFLAISSEACSSSASLCALLSILQRWLELAAPDCSPCNLSTKSITSTTPIQADAHCQLLERPSTSLICRSYPVRPVGMV